jgi:hypothetical protein
MTIKKSTYVCYMQCWVDDERHGLLGHGRAGVGVVEVHKRTEVEPARRL